MLRYIIWTCSSSPQFAKRSRLLNFRFIRLHTTICGGHCQKEGTLDDTVNSIGHLLPEQAILENFVHHVRIYNKI